MRSFLLLVLVLSFYQSVAARAEVRAVLVGASDYDQSIGLADLRGPTNDVRLLSDVLRRRGVTSVTVLADGIEGAVRPTRAAILTALEAQAQQAKAGDFVYLHFSGHGTRQADPSGDEADGLDEVFLPVDAGRAPDGTGLIANALVDDEIGRAVDAIRARGADVWLVLDSCHSGSGLRAADTAGVARYVDPAVLGVAVGPAAPGPAVSGPALEDDLPGGFVAFYAARSDEVAREYDLDPGPEDSYYGLFSAKLAARLETSQGWTFRQLYQAVLSDLNDTTLPGVARLQTPSWDGTLMDRGVFGAAGSGGPRRFSVQGDELGAGIVQNIGNGTLVALFSEPADPLAEALGYAQVTDASATRAYLLPVAGDCVPKKGALCPASGTLPTAVRFAQVVARPVDLTVWISPPRDLSSGLPLMDDHPALRALTAAVEASNGALRMDPQSFEVETVWDGAALWFGRRAALGAQPIGLSWVPGSGPLAPLLTRIARAEAYARLIDGLTGGGGLFNENPVEVTGLRLPSHVDDLALPGRPEPTRRECARAFAAADRDTPEPLSAHGDVKQCDRLLFRGKGATEGIRDVNILHIDAQYCVHADYARVAGASNPIALGAVMNICSDCPGDVYSAGDERIYVVVSEAAENAAPLRLQGLVETCDAGPTRSGAAQADLLSSLGDMARRPDTRGGFGGLGVSDIWVQRFDLTVLPRQEVFRRHAAK